MIFKAMSNLASNVSGMNFLCKSIELRARHGPQVGRVFKYQDISEEEDKCTDNDDRGVFAEAAMPLSTNSNSVHVDE